MKQKSKDNGITIKLSNDEKLQSENALKKAKTIQRKTIRLKQGESNEWNKIKAKIK